MTVTSTLPNTSIVELEDEKYLIHYESTVAKLDKHTNEITLGPNWNCSRTTLKRVNNFLGQSTATTRKQLAEGIISLDKNLTINSH